MRRKGEPCLVLLLRASIKPSTSSSFLFLVADAGPIPRLLNLLFPIFQCVQGTIVNQRITIHDAGRPVVYGIVSSSGGSGGHSRLGYHKTTVERVKDVRALLSEIVFEGKVDHGAAFNRLRYEFSGFCQI